MGEGIRERSTGRDSWGGDERGLQEEIVGGGDKRGVYRKR